jgi:hypothetical protein
MRQPDGYLMSELREDPIAMISSSISIDSEAFEFQKKLSVDYDWNQFLWELAMDWRHAEQNPDVDPEQLKYSRELAALLLGNAVASKDSAFFRTIADILDRLPGGTLKDIDRLKILISHDLTPLRFVAKARALLAWDQTERRLAGAPRRTVCKKDVRLLAERMWAMARLVARGKLSSLSRRNPAKTEKLIQAEIESLPSQDWTEIFEKAGCADLANARAGRPPKRKKKI